FQKAAALPSMKTAAPDCMAAVFKYFKIRQQIRNHAVLIAPHDTGNHEQQAPLISLSHLISQKFHNSACHQ
ncbi:MAG: hypothetical protein LUF30_11335, partial [Lachnospiraceae bacterium]|nr:hypothetical protein [Lachnospiraceae bacterium]